MKMDNMAELAPPGTGATSPEVFRQLGLITRQLHDTLTQLGVMATLRDAANGLPDARSRLGYVARKTGEAAERVLNSVDLAKQEHRHIAGATRDLAGCLAAEPDKAVASRAVRTFVADVEGATARLDGHLTDIMLAQDFHDLTGQVVAKVVLLATDLESSLVKLLVQSAPPAQARKAESVTLSGPVIDAGRSADVVNNQGEVDDLLASLGF